MRRVDGKKEFKIYSIYYHMLYRTSFIPFRQGSVFVEFADVVGVDAFLNADPKPSWKGDELLSATRFRSKHTIFTVWLVGRLIVT